MITIYIAASCLLACVALLTFAGCGETCVTPEARTGEFTIHGKPMTLLGPKLHVGDAAPNFTLTANDMSAVTLADYAGRTIIISTVPSLDTPVCDVQTRRFNDEAAKCADIVILTVSTDLPFAQRRWCGAAGADSVVTLSDHRDTNMGLAYGVLIKENRLLARSVWVISANRKIRYIQIVPEATHEPDYEAALAALK